MVSLDIGSLPRRGRLFMDSAPIIYFLEDHPELGPRFAGIFERAETGQYELVISTVSLAEVLTGPLRLGNERLAHEYRDALTAPPTWLIADLTPEIAHRAARIRGRSRLRLPDSVQLATAFETSCTALVTYDRDFRVLDDAPELIPIYS